MRQKVGEKKARKYRAITGLPVCSALVRGGTDHRIDLLLKGGEIVCYWPNTGEMELYDIGWDYKKWLLENPDKDCDYPIDSDLLNKLYSESKTRKIREEKELDDRREALKNMEPWLRVALGYGVK